MSGLNNNSDQILLNLLQAILVPTMSDLDRSVYALVVDPSDNLVKKILLEKLTNTGDFELLVNKTDQPSIISGQQPSVTKYLSEEGSVNLINFLKNNTNGIAGLDSNGKLDLSVIPDLAINKVVVANENTFEDFLLNADSYTFEQGDVIEILKDDGTIELHLFKGGVKTESDNYATIAGQQITIDTVVDLRQELDGKVPYTGANQNVDLGIRSIKSSLSEVSSVNPEIRITKTDTGKEVRLFQNDNPEENSVNLRFPSKSGELALTEDIDERVPYTGANQNVNLGDNLLNSSNLKQDGSSVYVGQNAGVNNTDSDVTTVGYYAGNNNKGTRTTFVGNNSGSENDSFYTIGLGFNSAKFNKGNYGIAIGSNSLLNNDGEYVSALGDSSAKNNIGDYGIAIGRDSLLNNSGKFNIGIGYQSQQNTTGIENIAIGTNAMAKNVDDTVRAKSVNNNSTNIIPSTNTINIFAHGFGAPNEIVRLKYTTNGQAISGLSNNQYYFFKVINSGSIESITNLNNTGGTAVHTFTPVFSYSNSISMGYYSARNNTASQVVAIGSHSGENNKGEGLVAIGENSGRNVNANNVTAVGSMAVSGQDTYQNTTGLGYNAQPTKENQVMLGDVNIEEVTTHGDYVTLGNGKGLILTSPDGTKTARISLDNSGNLVTTAI